MSLETIAQSLNDVFAQHPGVPLRQAKVISVTLTPPRAVEHFSCSINTMEFIVGGLTRDSWFHVLPPATLEAGLKVTGASIPRNAILELTFQNSTDHHIKPAAGEYQILILAR